VSMSTKSTATLKPLESVTIFGLIIWDNAFVVENGLRLAILYIVNHASI